MPLKFLGCSGSGSAPGVDRCKEDVADEDEHSRVALLITDVPIKTVANAASTINSRISINNLFY